MKQIVTTQKERVATWVASKIGCSSEWGAHEAIGLESDGELVAGVVIESYKKNASCSIHCAGTGKTWLNREFLYVVFDYVFRQLKCNVVINTVSSANEASVRFTRHIGFAESLRIEGGAADGALIIFLMPRSACRWLSLKRGDT